MQTVKIIFGILCGGYVGAVLGVLAAMALGMWAMWNSPHDPSAGAVSILVIVTFPAGAILGGGVGAAAIANSPRLFLATFLPLAIIFLAIQVTFRVMRSIDRQRHYVVQITGTSGAEFCGEISIDGKNQRYQGKIPGQLEFVGNRLRSKLVLRDPTGENNIAIKVWVDGRDLETGTESQTGIRQDLLSKGYSETFRKTSHGWTRMWQDEVEAVAKEFEQLDH